MNLMITIVAFLVALGLLIVFHEYGHYLAARFFDVKVLRFSVGFGRPVASRRHGPDQTEWALGGFPFGGYVKMLDEREGPVAPAEMHRAFNRQPVHRRFVIVAAGPIANFLLAILLYWGLFLSGVPGMKPVIGSPLPNSPAAAAGFERGETLSRIDGVPMQTWQDARWALLKAGVERTTVKIEAVGADGYVAVRSLDLSGLGPEDLDGEFIDTVGLTRFQPQLPPKIGQVLSGRPAERAGFKPGDEIIAIDGIAIRHWEEVVRAVSEAPDETLEIEVRRPNGVEDVVKVVPDAVTENGRRIGRVGFAPLVDPKTMEDLRTEVRYGFFEGFTRAVARTWEMSVFSLQMMGKMILGDVSLKNLSGPLTIADYAGQSAQMGWVPYLSFLALVSVSLGVLNLLPIPLLDGGHLMYYIAEIIKGRPVSERALEMGQHVGIALLFTLMAFAIYNDITRLLGG
ncbi:MAG: RIP metalloprotease RseP [Betaproteobacteria bacterium]|nr:RIP metalloprotease RseP [Betaproteobacteria bacterium]